MRNKRLKEKTKEIALSNASRTLEVLKELQESGLDKNLEKMEKAYSNLFKTKEDENESITGSDTETETGSTGSVGEKTEGETEGDDQV
jgi:hypothetical protein